MEPLSKEVVNAVSDVIMNRPGPIRMVDQIYMKAGDLALQAFYVADRYADQEVVFVGDGDAVALTIVYLAQLGLLPRSPSQIQVLDFDERIVNSILRFSDKHRIVGRINAELYNVVDPLPECHMGRYDAFYTNPPWGASNDGESVKAFVERGMEASKQDASLGLIVIADDPVLSWSQEVLQNIQTAAISRGFMVSELVPSVHFYHLDDAPDLKSCNCMIRRVRPPEEDVVSMPMSADRFKRFYGRNNPLRIRYIKERPTLNTDRAPEETYEVVPLEMD